MSISAPTHREHPHGHDHGHGHGHSHGLVHESIKRSREGIRAVLVSLAVLALAGAVVVGVYGASLVSWWGLAFIGVGGFLVPAYNLEWFGGRFHTDLWFAVMWGGFPALAGAFSQTGRIDVATLLVCTACGLIAAAQRRLSTPVRKIRRRVTSVTGELVDAGASEPITAASLTDAPEGALRMLWLAMVALALGLVITRWP
jgi:hypothetical protein